jgi:hypothetical protein
MHNRKFNCMHWAGAVLLSMLVVVPDIAKGQNIVCRLRLTPGVTQRSHARLRAGR